MSKIVDEANAAARTAVVRFRHLPDAIPLEDTVTSVPGDSALEPRGEPNAFIAAAIRAGG